MSIGEFSDDALAKRFAKEYRIVWFDQGYWVCRDGDGWVPVPVSADWRWPLLEVIRDFCGGVREEALALGGITQSQEDRLCLRLGGLPTWRRLHKLVPKREGPEGNEFRAVANAAMNLDMEGWWSEPAKVEDFSSTTDSRWSPAFLGNRRCVTFKGKLTGFNITYKSGYGPFKVCWGIQTESFHWWRGEYPSVEAAVKATAQYILEAALDEPEKPEKGPDLRLVEGGVG